MSGRPHRSKSGQLGIRLNALPELLAPCLHTVPTGVQDPETRVRVRHVDFFASAGGRNLLLQRAGMISALRNLLEEWGCVEVQTPILAADAGGAPARPFRTAAGGGKDGALALRVAPELWLKRMIIGGFEMGYEIGPCFRNEGTHNRHQAILIPSLVIRFPTASACIPSTPHLAPFFHAFVQLY